MNNNRCIEDFLCMFLYFHYILRLANNMIASGSDDGSVSVHDYRLIKVFHLEFFVNHNSYAYDYLSGAFILTYIIWKDHCLHFHLDTIKSI